MPVPFVIQQTKAKEAGRTSSAQ